MKACESKRLHFLRSVPRGGLLSTNVGGWAIWGPPWNDQFLIVSTYPTCPPWNSCVELDPCLVFRSLAMQGAMAVDSLGKKEEILKTLQTGIGEAVGFRVAL